MAGPLRRRYFGVNFALLNLGIDAGGLIAGVLLERDLAIVLIGDRCSPAWASWPGYC